MIKNNLIIVVILQHPFSLEILIKPIQLLWYKNHGLVLDVPTLRTLLSCFLQHLRINVIGNKIFQSLVHLWSKLRIWGRCCKLIERFIPIDVLFFYASILVHVLQKDNISRFLICKSQTIWVYADSSTICQYAIPVELVALLIVEDFLCRSVYWLSV